MQYDTMVLHNLGQSQNNSWITDSVTTKSLLKKFISKKKCTTQGYDCNSNVMFRIGNSSFKSVIYGKGRGVPVLN